MTAGIDTISTLELFEIHQALRWRTVTLRMVPSTLELRISWLLDNHLEALVTDD